MTDGRRNIFFSKIQIVKLVLIILIFSFLPALAKESSETLTIYGEGFALTVKEPAGWRAETQNIKQFGANVMFYQESFKYENANAIIRVLIVPKTDENTSLDLSYDMDQYRSRYPSIQFQDIKLGHQTYSSHSKLFLIQNGFFEYVTYLNPGKGIPRIISIAMKVQKRVADKEELEAYQIILNSLILVTH